MQVDYNLGKKVWKLRASDEDGVEDYILGNQLSNMSLSCAKMRWDGYSTAGALAASRADCEVRSPHFVMQNTQETGVKRDRTQEDPHRLTPTRNTRPKSAEAGSKGAVDR